MFNARFIVENSDDFCNGLVKRGYSRDDARSIVETVIAKRNESNKLKSEIDHKKSQINVLSKKIGSYNRAIGECTEDKGRDSAKYARDLMEDVTRLKNEINIMESKFDGISLVLDEILSNLPNLPLNCVPHGSNSDHNQLVKSVGSIPSMNFEPKQHFELGEVLGGFDFESAGHMSGTRFVVIRGALARLERALGQFMLDMAVKHGYEECQVPLLVREKTMFGTGQLPKFEDDLFKTTDGRYLIPTAEVSLTNLVADQIVDTESLPLRFTALTPCFRSEAGSAGRDVRGILRQHQFNKVELVSIVKSDDGQAELERMLGAAEAVLQAFDLPYRVMLLCGGDMGFSARKTYDIEVWLPGQKTYREISSCSYCGDFQARRMNARHKPRGRKGTDLVHTLNGSGVAVGRLLIAIMENYQNEDGTITVPKALRPYMNGMTTIRPN